MSTVNHPVLRADMLVVDSRDQLATLDGSALNLSPKALNLLTVLMQAQGKLVRKQDMFDAVWPNVTVGDAALTTVIKELRQALSDQARAPEWIQTVHGKGYRFGKPVFCEGSDDKDRTQKDSIAVLPFVDMSDSNDQAYFAEGVSEEILNALAKAPGLRVASRTSSFAFKNSAGDIKQIGASLNVAHLLEGSVRKAGERVRITAQLIQVSNGFHLWSETYDGELSDVFDLQERVATAVAGQLCAMLTQQQKSHRLALPLTQSLEAYDSYLQARSLMHSTYQADVFDLAIAKLEHALGIDPQFCEAWTTLSQVHQQSFFYGGVSGRLAHERSLEAARKACAIREDAESLHRFAYAMWQDNDKCAALSCFDEMRALAPNDAGTYHLSAVFKALMGQTSAAIADYEHAILIDPLSKVSKIELAMTYQNADQYDRSDLMADQAIEFGNYTSFAEKAWNAFARGDVGLAEVNLLNIFDKGGAHMTDVMGGRGVWEAIARAVFRENPSDRAAIRGFLSMLIASEEFEFDQATAIAMVYLGMNDELFDHWEKARFSVSNILLQRAWSDLPWAKAFRTHPRFPEFADRIGLVEVWQKHGWPDKFTPPAPGRNFVAG